MKPENSFHHAVPETRRTPQPPPITGLHAVRAILLERLKRRRLPLSLSAILYAIALFCPPFVLQEGNSGFLLGFVCLLFGFGELAWYANPLYFASLITLGTMKKSFVPAILSAAALAVALNTVAIEELPRNEAGNMTAVIGYGPGFYLWLASMLVVLNATILRFLRRSRE